MMVAVTGEKLKKAEKKMNSERKKELMQQYKAMPTFYGIIQIKNTKNGKIFIDAVPNTKNRWTFYKLNLENNFYSNTPLQQDWNTYGEAAFAYEVLWQKDSEKVSNMKAKLKKIKKEWFDQLQPFGEAGYNKPLKD
jgi:ssDNA-binding Zn-finger/Zn-ribbon topoisomerase 1